MFSRQIGSSVWFNHNFWQKNIKFMKKLDDYYMHLRRNGSVKTSLRTTGEKESVLYRLTKEGVEEVIM